MSTARVIAFYLPQFHPTEDNDRWWGKGFTEWTNVGKAVPLFKGHYQPKVPADLGYYDLRLPVIREQQAALAKHSGIEGFCYYHYWFGEGKTELEMPFNEVVKSGSPDFPFCLCWANETWHAKLWKNDGTSQNRALLTQSYPGRKDNEAHFYSLLSAFKDKRYIRYKGKPVFMVYRPFDFAGVGDFMRQWNDLAQKNGFPGFHFVAQCMFAQDINKVMDLGFDAVNILRLNNFISLYKSRVKRRLTIEYHKLTRKPYVYEYRDILGRLVGEEERQANVYPSLIPNWDHTPRSGNSGYLLHHAEPRFFKQHVESVLKVINDKDPEDRMVFLKSWNEWGEGNYVEPDLRYGHGYLDVLKACLLDAGEDGRMEETL